MIGFGDPSYSSAKRSRPMPGSGVRQDQGGPENLPAAQGARHARDVAIVEESVKRR